MFARHGGVAAKIKAAAVKGETMVVHGEINKDETAIAVTQVNAPVAGEKPKGAGHHAEKPAAAK